MGYHTELNTLLGLPADFDTKKLVVGERYQITRERERCFPLHLAILMVTHDWNFLGYAFAHSIVVKDFQTVIEFEVISLFSSEMQKIYRDNFLFAAKITGEIK
ncbi:MAG: hypothetical protein M1514_03315 [Patescibacteria group bacterium]|nr:hypothetical protein [Patescibacteria group bacterium]